MRVDWAIPCRYVEVTNGLATMVGAGIDCYFPPSFPAQLDAVVGVRLVGNDPGGSHVLESVVLDPDLNEVFRLTSTFTTENNPSLPAGWESQLILPTVHRFVAEREGAYTLSLTADGSPAHTVVISVRQQG